MNDKNLIEIDDYLSTSTNFNFLKLLDVDNALDLRDESEFDYQWMNVFNSLKMCDFNANEVKFINMLREKAFKQSFKIINNFEISSRISDDIEIIAKSFIAKKYKNWAITHLWSTYKNKKFPI
ncbi:MAG: hypothetical protein J6569_10725 [Gilliamella sp.]|uniref:hypothetical protein n=2 Tax=Pseudomonadota TaxID=1224 RepID=UPI000A14BB39|nr:MULTISPECIES: hypothetical protein [Gilliamella]MCO6540586.1 hypothetical protein [Gilliamella sp.]MCO6548814.1 hypothetical protein [Gilliamella sp.]MCO6557720.1 hypothetical protein [Gilliamella sp.]NUE96362.1 hypothetical protein [Gilliamella sp. ESL0232]